MASGSKSIQYSESTRRIASCDNMEDFWQTCVRLPQPSELLSNRMALNVADRFRTIDARMVFREGITPQWEDEANAQGGHLQVQFKPSLGGGQLNEYWNNLVLGVIGGTIEPADVITSVRLVNVYVGSGSNLQTRSGMTWKGVSLAGTQWSRWQLSSYVEHCRSSRRAVLEKFAPHREEQCWIRSVTRGPQPTRHVALTSDRVHFSAGKKRKTSSREWMWT